jgi:simple sugar transport system ATP-binding protein
MEGGAPPSIVEMHGIVKQFGSLTALAGVDLSVRAGDIHAVVGENGAGKTTLMHILTGLTQADAGGIAVRGRAESIASVERANALGIAMVHQHFMLLPSLSVAENLTLGREPTRRGLFDRAAARRAVVELGERYHLQVDPDARVEALSLGDLQRLEILRALYRGAEVLILDEPTAVLTPSETEGLFRVLRELKTSGKTTIFISHKLAEVLAISDTITVLRDGKVTGRLRTAETQAREIARLMVGREVMLAVDRPAQAVGAPLLQIERLVGSGVKGISLDVHAGEIVGIAGVTGNGQSELADMIAGLLPAQAGSIRINGHDVTQRTVLERRGAGLAYVPEDRFKQGLAARGSISDNLLLGSQTQTAFVRRGILNRTNIRQRARSLVERFRVKVGDVEQAVQSLSGGNAQRVVIARELADDKPLLLAAQPTRGIDIAASEFAWEAILKRRRAGAGVLLISADLNEILALSDRILVMFAGRIIGEVAAADADETRLGLLMAGVASQEVEDAQATRF